MIQACFPFMILIRFEHIQKPVIQWLQKTQLINFKQDILLFVSQAISQDELIFGHFYRCIQSLLQWFILVLHCSSYAADTKGSDF